MKGNLVPRGIGNRVARRTIRRQQPNIRTKRMNIGGTSLKVRLCSSCLKRLKKDAAEASAAAKAHKDQSASAK